MDLTGNLTGSCPCCPHSCAALAATTRQAAHSHSGVSAAGGRAGSRCSAACMEALVQQRVHSSPHRLHHSPPSSAGRPAPPASPLQRCGPQPPSLPTAAWQSLAPGPALEPANSPRMSAAAFGCWTGGLPGWQAGPASLAHALGCTAQLSLVFDFLGLACNSLQCRRALLLCLRRCTTGKCGGSFMPVGQTRGSEQPTRA